MSDDKVIGTARIDIVVDADAASVGIAKAKSSIQSFSTEAQNAYNQASAAEKRATTNLLKWLELSGKTVESQKLLNAAMAGVPVQILEEVRQKMMDMRASTDAAAASAKELSGAYDFEQQHQSAKKLVQSAEYVNWWKDSLQQADLVEKQLKDNLIFEQQHQSARQLVQDSEYVGWWKDALLQADIAEKNLADSNLFESQHQAAKRLTQSGEYVRFWEDALDEANAAEAKIASDKAFVQALQDRANIAGKTSAELREMALAELEVQAAERGLSAQAAPLINQLREKEAQFSKFGKTSKEVDAALRGVPAQITDIVVSLQGGQAPLTVLLQQGGQLKDMFGGVVPAAQALGTSLLGLIGPWTLTATAIGGMGLAAYQSVKQIEELNAALILTGGGSGLSLSGIRELADQLGVVTGRFGEAREAAEALVSSGISADLFSQIGQTAIEFADVSSASIDTVVGHFKKLQDEGAAGAFELNKEFKFLTASVYEQATALEEQGKKQEAAALLQERLMLVTNKRIGEVKAELNLLGQAWDWVGKRALASWAEMGKALTKAPLVDQLKELGNEFNIVNNQIAFQEKWFGGSNFFGLNNLKQRRKELADEMTAIQQQMSGEAIAAQGKKALQDSEDAATEMLELRKKYLQEGRSREQQRADEVKAEKAQWEKLSKGLEDGSAEYTKLYQAHQNKLTEIDKKYQERKTGGGSRGQSELATIKARTAAETELIARLQDRTTANAKLTDAEKAILKLQADLTTKLDAKTRADKEAALVAAQGWREEEKRRIALEGSKKAIEAAEKATQKQIDDAWKSVEAIQGQTKAIEDQIKTLGLGKAAIAELKLSDMDRILADEDSYAEDYILAIRRAREEVEKLRNAQNTLTYSEILKQQEQELKNSEDQADLLSVQAGLIGKSGTERDKILAKLKIQQALEKEIQRIKEQTLAGEGRETLIENAKAQAAQDTINALNEIDQNFNAELINNMVDAGRSVWVDFTSEGEMSFKSLERTFKATIASAIYDLTLKPIIVNVVGSVLSGGSSGSGGGLGGLLNGNGLSSLRGIGSSSMYTGFATSSLGQALGLSTALPANAGAAGAGLMNAMNGVHSTTTASMTGLGAGLGTALSVVGWAAAAYQLIDLIKGLDGSGDPHQGAVAWADNYGLGGSGQGHSSNPYREEIGDALYGMGSGIAQSMERILADFGQVGKHITVMTSWLDDFDGEGGSWGNFSISIDGNELVNWANESWDSKWSPREFSPMEEGYEEYVAAVAESYMRALTMALKESDIPNWASDMLDSVDADATIDEINAVLNAIMETKAIFAGFSDTIVGFSKLNDDALTALLGFSGGMEPLTANMSAFYENFYSEQEKIDNLTRQMTDSLGKYGIALPETTADFRALVEQTMATGESGTELLAVLLAMNGTFYEVATATDTVTESLRSASDIAKERATLEERWLTAIGDTAAIAALARAEIDATNLALYDQIIAQEAANKAAEEAAAAELALANSRASIEDQIFKLTATTAEQRAAELAAMDESLRPLQERYYALLDEKTAAEEAAAAAEQAAQERTTLEERLLTAMGDTAALAARARDAIHETNRALYDQVLAQEAANQAAEEAAVAAQSVGSALSEAFNVRNTAGNLLDKISGAMGNDEAYAAVQEQRLWAAMATASYSQQIDLASQLTDIVLNRYQVEQQASEKQLQYAQSLRSYVDGLLTGNLSPLTTAEKLAEAASQYQSTLSAARAGDTDALSNLQGQANSYLELARTYYASGSEYTQIFGSVTVALDGLSASAQSEAQRQLSVSSASFAELQKLYSITESAYAQADAEVLTQQALLDQQLQALYGLDDGLTTIADVIGGLPAELGALFNGHLLAGTLMTDPAVDIPGVGAQPVIPETIINSVVDWGTYQNDNAALVAEVKALREEVRMLRDERKAGDQQQVQATVIAAQNNAQQIVSGIDSAVDRAAYLQTTKEGATYA